MKLGITSNSGVYANDYSIEFNGSTQYAEVDALAGKCGVNTGTISLWAKIPTLTSSAFLFRAQSGSSSASDNILQMIYHASSNELRMTYKGAGTTRTATISNGNTDIEGQGWKHFVGTYDTSENEIKVYMNGVLKDTKDDQTVTAFDAALDNCDIGRNTGSGGGFAKGEFCDLAIFDTIVSATTLYNGGVPFDLTGMSGLKGYFKFQEGTTSIGEIVDSSGQATSGDFVNSPTYSTDTP
tara:strand:+ start:595 stop:1311 length:717 start_codon:yes stop_codon:yes gene_type:complete